MNCCAGTDHGHSGNEHKDAEHNHGESGTNWTQIGAVLLIIVLVAGTALTFLK
ncbi:MAG TPA: hypothetical protein VJG83_02295 [archaeon]|nr:hypothetical protein [archaeon]